MRVASAGCVRLEAAVEEAKPEAEETAAAPAATKLDADKLGADELGAALAVELASAAEGAESERAAVDGVLAEAMFVCMRRTVRIGR